MDLVENTADEKRDSSRYTHEQVLDHFYNPADGRRECLVGYLTKSAALPMPKTEGGANFSNTTWEGL